MNWFIIVVLICIIVITQLIYIYLENVVCIREGNSVGSDTLTITTFDTLVTDLNFTQLKPYFLYYKGKLETYTIEIRNYDDALRIYKEKFNEYTAKQAQLNKETIRLNKCSKNFFKKII